MGTGSQIMKGGRKSLTNEFFSNLKSNLDYRVLLDLCIYRPDLRLSVTLGSNKHQTQWLTSG